MNNHEDLRPLQ